MITITIYKEATNFTGFFSTGHAEYAEQGNDIVCSAVSVLLQTFIASVEQLLDHSDAIRYGVKKGEDNSLFMTFPKEMPFEDWEKSQTLFKSMLIGLSMIQEQYPENVSVKYHRTGGK